MAAEILGVFPGSGCDFGFCNPFGNGLTPDPDDVGALATVCAIQPEVCLGGLIIVTVYEAARLGPGIIDSIKQLGRKPDLATADEAVRQIEAICGFPINRRRLHDELQKMKVKGEKLPLDLIVQVGVAIFCPEKGGQ